MTLTEYAKRRGCSLKSVSLAASTGRLVASVGRSPNGRAVSILDPDLADREWEANTRRVSRGTSEPCELPDATWTPATWTPASQKSRPAALQAMQERQRPAGGAGDAGAAAPPFNVSRDLRAAAAARREAALADQAELDLAARRGKLVDADEARADVFARISMAKTKLLGIPEQVGQDAPDLAARVVPLVERRVREALEELSDG